MIKRHFGQSTAIALAGFTALLVLSFQNCSRTTDFRTSPTDLSAKGPGNGEGFEGMRTLYAVKRGSYGPASQPVAKPAGCLYQIVDVARSCMDPTMGRSRYQAAIEVLSGQPSRVYDNVCSDSYQTSNDIEIPLYDGELAGHGDGIYQCVAPEIAPDPLAPENALWCRSTQSPLEGLDLVIKKLPNVASEAPALELDLAGSLPASLTHSRTDSAAGSATYIGADGLIHAAAAGAPRFTFASGESLGLLIEGARTNLLPASEDFANAAWVPYSVTLATEAAAAPDGRSTAERVSWTQDRAEHVIRSNFPAASGQRYTMSVYVKPESVRLVRFEVGGGNSVWTIPTPYAIFNLASLRTLEQTAEGAKVERAPNGYLRISLTHSAASGGDGYFRIYLLQNDDPEALFAPPGGGSLLVWGAQAEAGDAASSYIPTRGAPASRGADRLQLTLPNSTRKGTLSALVTTGSDSGSLFALGTNSGALALGANGSLTANIGALTTTAAATDFAAGSTSIIGFAFDGDAGFLLLARGSAIAAKAFASTTASAFAEVAIGTDSTGGNPLGGTVRKLWYWPKALDEGSLAAGPSARAQYTGELKSGSWSQASGSFEAASVHPFSLRAKSVTEYGSDQFKMSLSLTGEKDETGRFSAHLVTEIDHRPVAVDVRCRIQD